MVEDTTVSSALTEWLLFVAFHLDLDSCILSGVATLRVSRLTWTLFCPQCSMLHSYWGQFVTQKHVNHNCRHFSTVFA